jgi:immunoglobulin-like protein involved in spore germination/sporulation and spore germination protein
VRLISIAAVAGALALAASPAGASGTIAAGASRATPLTVYLVHGMHVAPVRRVVFTNGAPARAALTALLRGPTSVERSLGYSTAIPAGTALRSVTVAGGLAAVDVSRRFASGGGSASMLLRIAQTVFTTTQFAAVDRVAFKLDGTLVRSIGGEGVVTLPPVTRRTFEAQAPPILVEKPLAGDRVSRKFVIRGTANVFEARLVVEVQTTNGTILVRRLVSATSGTGTRGTFSTIVVLPAALRQAVVVVYTRSAKDGRPIDVARIPVRLSRR